MQLQSFFQFHDPQYKHIIKYISIRWLSLEAAVGRALRLLPLLTSYFLSEEDKSPQFERISLVYCFQAIQWQWHLQNSISPWLFYFVLFSIRVTRIIDQHISWKWKSTWIRQFIAVLQTLYFHLTQLSIMYY